MQWLWSRSKNPAAAQVPLAARERRAYAAIEEARLWCEEALAHPVADDERRRLTAVHREIGLAGLHASHNLRPERRRAMLELAHKRAGARVPRGRHAVTIDSLGELVDHALGHVGPALGVEGLCDEMAKAQQRLLAAQALLAVAPRERRRVTTG